MTPDSDAPPPEFIKPTLVEAAKYAIHIGLPIDEVMKFIDYYEKNGWTVMKKPMKCWKRALVNWRIHWEKPYGKRNYKVGTGGAGRRNEHVSGQSPKGRKLKADEEKRLRAQRRVEDGTPELF